MEQYQVTVEIMLICCYILPNVILSCLNVDIGVCATRIRAKMLMI